MPQSPSWIWDIFCRVIDNYGDVGVCWRLARQLARRGHRVRLWLDDHAALRWMAPLASRPAGLQVLAWMPDLPASTWAPLPPAQVWVEAFGCELPHALIEQRAAQVAAGDVALPHWINLEYLSAEPYVERMHGLPSPVQTGPARGWIKHFFYPGFTVRTGGLLREQDLLTRQADFDRAGWLSQQGIPLISGERLLSLFCYEPPALSGWLQQLARCPTPTRLLVTPGRASAAVRACLGGALQYGALGLHYLPYLSQDDYDALLWACDFNCVRGEDSLVRALWAAKPFVWQPYPQDDGAHAAKLEAWLRWMQVPADWRLWHRIWSALDKQPLPAPDLPAWGEAARTARDRVLAQSDLVTQLTRFIGRPQ